MGHILCDPLTRHLGGDRIISEGRWVREWAAPRRGAIVRRRNCRASGRSMVTAHTRGRGGPMPKVLECAKVDPSSGCQHIVRGETEDEVLRNAGEHAKEHGI